MGVCLWFKQVLGPWPLGSVYIWVCLSENPKWVACLCNRATLKTGTRVDVWLEGNEKKPYKFLLLIRPYPDHQILTARLAPECKSLAIPTLPFKLAGFCL